MTFIKKALLTACFLTIGTVGGILNIPFTVNAEYMEVTGYTSTGCQMANGEWPHVGAVASNHFPLGTVLYINGNYYVVKDRTGEGHEGVDIFFDSHEEAIQFGWQWLDVQVVQ